MTFSWHGHMFQTKWPPCSGKRQRYPPVRCAMMFRFVWERLSAWIVWIFASSASLWHHLVVDSRVHHVQSCAYSWKHKRMWQTAEVSSKISNLASNRHVPLRAGTQKSSDRILARKRPKNTRTTAQLWCLWEHDKEYVVVLYTSKHYCTDRDNTGGPM